MNIRRILLIMLGAASLTPRVMLAQAKKPPVVIGWLEWGSRDSIDGARKIFNSELAALGWKEGSNYVLNEAYADGNANQLPALAAEIAARQPALIVAIPVPAARAAAKAAPNTPVVLINGDPVTAGLVASYARPGGMVTGISNANQEIAEKYLELLLAAAPSTRRVGFLLNSTSGNFLQQKENASRAVTQFSIEARTAELARVEEVMPVLARFAKEGVQALVVMSAAGALRAERQRILEFAAARRWPVIGGASWADAGALLSYSADISAQFRRGAHYVDRILKGAKPGELPIERPMTFELVLNMKTAKALGLTIPHEFGARVDRMIQ